MSTIDPNTIEAYRGTEYRVSADGDLVLRIGEASPPLVALHGPFRVTCSAFVTACNPFSAELSGEENRTRQADLEQDLRARRLRFLPGIGQHPSNGWPGEPSFVVLGIDLPAAKALGVRLEQNAIVWAGESGVPELVLLR
jgi:hypothetical protein